MKLITKVSLVAALAAAAVLPITPFAQAAVRDQSLMPARDTSFCGRLTAGVAENFTKALAGREKERTGKASEIKQELKESRAAEDAKVKEQRTKAEKELEKNLSTLEESISPAGKQALAQFKTLIKQAMAARKTAVDAANKAFRVGMDKIHADRQAAIQKAASAYKSAVQAAIAKAKTDCASGTDAAVVRQTLADSLKSAQEKYRTDLKVVDKTGEQVNQLTKTRNEAIRAANQTFKMVMEAVRAQLKAAMPDGGGTATTTP